MKLHWPKALAWVFVVGWLWTADAWASVDISCPCSYEFDGDSATLRVDRITNNGDNTTGTLYLSLWFTTSDDPYTTGHLAARASLASDDDDGTLPPNSYYYDVSLTTEFTQPPPGEYYVHLYVSEYPDLNTTLDLITITDTLTFGPHVDIGGTVSFRIDGDSVTLRADRIENNSDTHTTGTLHLSLLFTTGADPAADGHLAARVSLASIDGLGMLPPNHYYPDVSLTTEFEPPPRGEYYVHLYVSESPDLDKALDLRTFTDTLSTGVRIAFRGNATYRLDDGTVTLGVDRIENDSDTNTTGTLHLSLWLTTGTDPDVAGHRVARVSLASIDGHGTLAPRRHYDDVRLTTAYEPPPQGEYYVHLYVSEAPNLRRVLDLVTFPNPLLVGDGVADDHGDVPAQATAVTARSSTAGQIESGGDRDVFRVEVAEPGVLRATTRGDTDTYGRLRDRDEQVVRVDDDGGEERNFLLEAHVASGVWYVEVSGYGADSTGSYVLDLAFEPDQRKPREDVIQRHLGDFNGDGRDDVLLRHTDGRWYYYPMNGRSHVLAGRGFANLTRDLHYSVAGIGDFNGDGRDDVLLRHLDGHWIYYPMNGRQHVPGGEGLADLTTDLDYRVVGIGDFNGDGRDDVLLRHRLDGRWYYYPMDGRHASADDQGHAELTTDPDYGVAGIGDFDGDGRDDVLLRHADGRWYYYPMNGRLPLLAEEGAADLTDDLNYAVAGIGDLNGDGRDDVLLRHADGRWYYYPMNGRLPLLAEEGAADLTDDLNYAVAGIGDLNGDGRDDVLLRHADGGWYYYAMNGRLALAGWQGAANLTDDIAWSVPRPVRAASIRGRVLVAQGQVLDGDTGDPNDPQVPNDTASNAQRVPMPVLIAGHLIEDFDDWDIYRVTLPAAPAATLIILVTADPDAADLDLHLADTDGKVLAESLGVENLEVIGTTLAGEHLVAVSTASGASNYSLVIAVTEAGESASAAAASWSRDGEFVPDELIVKPKDDALDVLADVAEDEQALRLTARMPSGSALLRMDSRVTPQLPLGDTLSEAELRYDAEDLRKRGTLLRLRKGLLASDAFEYVQPNTILRANAVPNDPFYDQQWHYPKIALPAAWDLTTGDDDIVTAVIDTGVVTDHPDLASRLLRDDQGRIVGYDFISDPVRANDGDGPDPDPYDAGDSPIAGGASSSHGTHVAGTVGAATDNGRGVAGVTWQGKIMPIRVLGIGGGTTLDTAEGIRFAAGLANSSGTVPSVRADVINLSLGRGNERCLPASAVDAVTKNALEAAIAAGVVVVVAAGNDDCHHLDPMAQVEGVITVGATDFLDDRAPYSNYGSLVDVVAPGGDVTVDHDGDGYQDGVLSTDRSQSRFLQGTSMAAPHVAGVVSLMLAANPELTPNDINRLLSGTHADPAAGPITWDLGWPGPDDDFGHGLIDAYRSVRVAQAIAGGQDEPLDRPALSVSPTRLYYGATADTLRVRLSNVGTGTLTIASIEVDAPWISVSYDEWPKLVVRVDRTNLADGTHAGHIAITSDGGNANVFATVQVQRNVLDADAGTVYVAAVDVERLAVTGWASTNVRGDYAFTMPAEDGQAYIVAAGTDRDGDGSICDAGEACGLWPLLDSPGIIDVDGDETLEFGVYLNLFAEVTSQSLPSDSLPPEGFLIDRSVQGADAAEPHAAP